MKQIRILIEEEFRKKKKKRWILEGERKHPILIVLDQGRRYP